MAAVASGIDPEPLRDQLRSNFWRSVAPEVQEELRRLAESIDVRRQHPATLVSPARTFRRAGDLDSAVRILRHAQYIYPGDYWVNFELAFVLNEQTDHEGAVRFYTAAAAIRPNLAAAHTNLGVPLSRQKRWDEAIAAWRKAIELDPK